MIHPVNKKQYVVVRSKANEEAMCRYCVFNFEDELCATAPECIDNNLDGSFTLMSFLGPINEDTQQNEWVTYDHNTGTYLTKDGTSVSAELCDNIECILDVFHIADIREKQRKEHG